MESATELVVDAASGHLRERLADHAAREFVSRSLPEAQHELPDHRLRKLWRAAQAPFRLVELAGDTLERSEEDVVAQQLHGAAELAALAELGGARFRRGRHPGQAGAPRAGRG